MRSHSEALPQVLILQASRLSAGHFTIRSPSRRIFSPLPPTRSRDKKTRPAIIDLDMGVAVRKSFSRVFSRVGPRRLLVCLYVGRGICLLVGSRARITSLHCVARNLICRAMQGSITGGSICLHSPLRPPSLSKRPAWRLTACSQDLSVNWQCFCRE